MALATAVLVMRAAVGKVVTFPTILTYHVNTTIILNTYNTRVTNVSETHVSYNGGTGGWKRVPRRSKSPTLTSTTSVR